MGITKGELTRQRLVAEAAKLFNQRGYEGSSMTDIMQATGLEKGGIYRHFASKEELAQEAFDYAWNAACEGRQKDLDRIESPVERLKQFIANFVEVRPAVPGGCPLLNTAVEADDGNATLRKRALAALRGWRARLAVIVSEAISQGEIKRDVNAETVATIVISCLEGALMISRLERDRNSLVEAQQHLLTYLASLTNVRATVPRD